jgi:hypothetical protein
MRLNFDLNSVKLVEFGVGRNSPDERSFFNVTVDKGVQNALSDMVKTTWAILSNIDGGPSKYEPSEKYEPKEYLFLPIDDDLASSLHKLQYTNNLPLDNKVLNNVDDVFCYFAKLQDSQGKILTAVRRATQFKGILSYRLIELSSDALKLVTQKVFKLDNDFDLLIDSKNIHILRPAAFEFTGQLKSAILSAVSDNIGVLKSDIKFIDFSNIESYAGSHPRAARYLASIKSSHNNKKINKTKLKKLCSKTKVSFSERNGKLTIDENNVMDFLEVLDRRRYELDIVDGQAELYKAPSRKRIN